MGRQGRGTDPYPGPQLVETLHRLQRNRREECRSPFCVTSQVCGEVWARRKEGIRGSVYLGLFFVPFQALSSTLLVSSPACSLKFLYPLAASSLTVNGRSIRRTHCFRTATMAVMMRPIGNKNAAHERRASEGHQPYDQGILPPLSKGIDRGWAAGLQDPGHPVEPVPRPSALSGDCACTSTARQGGTPLVPLGTLRIRTHETS